MCHRAGWQKLHHLVTSEDCVRILMLTGCFASSQRSRQAVQAEAPQDVAWLPACTDLRGRP